MMEEFYTDVLDCSSIYNPDVQYDLWNGSRLEILGLIEDRITYQSPCTIYFPTWREGLKAVFQASCDHDPSSHEL